MSTHNIGFYEDFFQLSSNTHLISSAESNRLTFVKCEPSLLRGTEGKDLFGFISKKPALKLYKLLMMISRSEVVFTGKNRLLGTLIPVIFLQ